MTTFRIHKITLIFLLCEFALRGVALASLRSRWNRSDRRWKMIGQSCVVSLSSLLALMRRMYQARPQVSFSLLAAMVACTAAFPVHAQVATGDVLGTVTDSTGALMPGVSIRIENSATHEVRNSVVNANGEYSFSALQPGSYVVTAAFPGFKAYTVSNVVVLASDRVRINPKLQTGSVDEHVEVSATPTALQTDSPTVGSTITATTLVDVPLNGRNYFGLVQVQAGVNPGTASSITSGNYQLDRRLSSAVSANGQQELFNNNLLDGLDNNGRVFGQVLLRPSVEAIGEVRTDINTYTADEGRSSGAIINVITNSGGNAIHGSVYEFFRNDVTDSRNYFATSALVAKKPELRQNQFGGSVSGPIRKDKTFFFADFESFRRIDSNNNVYISTVPTAAEEATPGYLADRGLPNILPSSIDPTSLGYFKLFPAPNRGAVGALTNNFIYDPASSLVTNTGDLRIDHHFSPKDTIFGRYSYNHTAAATPEAFPSVNGVVAGGNLQGPGDNIIRVQGGQLGYTHIYSPALIMELKMGYSFFGESLLPANYGQNLNNSAPYLIPNANVCALCSGLAFLGITGFTNLGDPNVEPNFTTEHNSQFAGSVTYTRGNHLIKAGASLIRRNFSYYANTFPKGNNNFANITNFLLGGPYSSNRQLFRFEPYDRTWEPSAFVQDEWRVSSRLTLTLGGRYEIFTTPNEKYGRYANFDLGSLSVIENATGGRSNEYHDVSPRVGFNATVAPGLVLRGGFGLSFYQGDSNTGLVPNDPPLGFASGTVQFTGPLSVTGVPAVTNLTAPPTPANLVGSVTSKPLHEADNYVEQYNLLAQKEFGGTTVTVGYVGQVGRHLSNLIPNYDIPAPAGPSPAGTPAPPLVYLTQLPGVNTIALYSNTGFSSFNSIQGSVERRISRGLTANVNYTHSHNLDDLQEVFDGDASSANGFADLPHNVNTYDYGNSALDLRQRFAGFFSYDLPFDNSRSRLTKAVLGGLRFNGLGFWQTGSAFTVTSAVTQTSGPSTGLATINLPTITIDRPNVVAPLVSTGAIGGFFNLNAFAQQPLGTPGNEKRNQFFGPHLRRGDLSLFKTIPIREAIKAELRAECINFTNTPNFTPPLHSIAAYASPNAAGGSAPTAAGGFGTITSTLAGYSGRQFQFAARLNF